MKATSLVSKKTAISLSAIAFSATLALGMVGCAAPAESSSASSAESVESSSSSAQVESSASEVSSSSQAAQATTQSSAQTSTSSPASDAKVTSDQAYKKALSHAKFKDSEVRLVKNEYEIDDGVAKYEIEFIGPDNKEYEYDIDANTEEIISFDSEPMHD